MRGAARAPASVGIEVAGVIARRILAPAWRSTQCEDQADDYYRKTIVSHDVAPSKHGARTVVGAKRKGTCLGQTVCAS